MNYYPFHIGDYHLATAHLEPMEDLAYRRLIDFYYQTEAPIPKETKPVSRRLRLDNDLVDSVLSEFFTDTESGWINSRCDVEIAKYQTKVENAKLNGNKGGRPKKTKRVISANRVITGSKTNQEPRTNNQDVLNPLTPPCQAREYLPPQLINTETGEILDADGFALAGEAGTWK